MVLSLLLINYPIGTLPRRIYISPFGNGQNFDLCKLEGNQAKLGRPAGLESITTDKPLSLAARLNRSRSTIDR